MRSLTDHKKQAIDILMKEYAASKTEMGIYISLFHKHSNLTPILIGSILTFIVSIATLNLRGGTPIEFVTSTNLVFLGVIKASIYSSILFFVFLSFLIVGMFYFSAAMGYLYLIELIAQRMRIIERNVNRELGKKVMSWDNDITIKFIMHSNQNFGIFVPNKMRVFWSQSSFFIVLAYLIGTSNLLLGRDLSILFATISLVVFGVYAVQVRNYRISIVPAIRKLGLP